MKKLENKANVNPPSVAWPFGEVRDKTLLVPGTKWDFEMMSDIIQFFSKMFDDSNLVANGLPDNFTNGFQLFEAYLKTSRPYKSYTALMNQSGLNAPVPTILENQLGAPIVWTRAGVGNYDGTLAGAFVTGKTFVMVNHGVPGAADFILLDDFDTNKISLISRTGAAVNTDGLLDDTPIEIRVYY